MNKFLQEIEEQPAALKDTLKYYTGGKGKDCLDRVISLWKSGQSGRHLSEQSYSVVASLCH